MVRKSRRKKLPVPERQPLVRPIQPNEVWTMDFARLPLRLCRLGLRTLAHQRGHAFGHALFPGIGGIDVWQAATLV